MTTASVWQQLSHDIILRAVEQTLQVKLSNLLLTRNSYINRVYELEEHDSRARFIVKFYRPGRWSREMILEEHRFLEELGAKEVPVIVPRTISSQTLFELLSGTPAPILYAIFPKKGGRALDEFDRKSWEELGRLLARIHLIGAEHKTSRRVTWRPSVATRHHLDVLSSTGYLLPDFEKAFRQIADMFIQKADGNFLGREFILLHGDCHKGNLIHRPGEGIYVIDFDDICFGPPVQDLWMLLPDDPEKCENELAWFFKGYDVFREFDRGALELVPWLRGMRIIHFASWLAVQSRERDFKTHFPHAGTPRYWNELIKELQEIVISRGPE